MAFYHMWVHIEDYKELYDCDNLLNAANDIGEIFGLKIEVIVNGTEVITATGKMNHFSQPVKNCIKFFEQLPLYLDDYSFGALYILDEEDLKLYDKFQVWSLKDGIVEKHNDNILSPIN